jgi:hypothetical protein
VGTYNADTGRAALYVDGELIGTTIGVGEIRLDPESLDRPLVIGAEINGPDINKFSTEFDGYVDDVRIYDRALAVDEIRALEEKTRR